MNKLPTFKELTSDLSLYEKESDLTFLLNQNPPDSWVKIHPYIKNWRYIPIDKVEHLLRSIFRDYKIEVLREGTAFNGVYVVVRIHYKDLLSSAMKYHDGIGAVELQTKAGESVANLSAINKGAVSMAFPIAKTFAIKDACDHFGRLFGSDLNRKDVVKIVRKTEKVDPEDERIMLLINTAKSQEDLDFAKGFSSEKHMEFVKAKQKEINLKTK